MTWIRYDIDTGLPLPGRASSQFRASVDATLNLLDSELEQLRTGEAFILTRHTAGERLRDGRPAGRGTAVTGAVRVQARSTRHGDLVWTASRYARWDDNLRAITLTLQNLRAIDRYGATTGEQYGGFKALPAGDGGAAARRQLCEIAALTDTPGVPIDELVKLAMRNTHPDRNAGERARWDRTIELARSLGVPV